MTPPEELLKQEKIILLFLESLSPSFLTSQTSPPPLAAINRFLQAHGFEALSLPLTDPQPESSTTIAITPKTNSPTITDDGSMTSKSFESSSIYEVGSSSENTSHFDGVVNDGTIYPNRVIQDDNFVNGFCQSFTNNEIVHEPNSDNNQEVVQVLDQGRRSVKKLKEKPLYKCQWTESEDRLLIELVREFGVQKWSIIAENMNNRVGKQCRERWSNHLRPEIKKDAWSEEEDRILVSAHEIFGNKWAEIAKLIPGRSENTIKNHWNATKRKQNSKRKAKDIDNDIKPSYLETYIRSKYPCTELTKNHPITTSTPPSTNTSSVSSDVENPSSYLVPELSNEFSMQEFDNYLFYENLPVFQYIGSTEGFFDGNNNNNNQVIVQPEADMGTGAIDDFLTLSDLDVSEDLEAVNEDFDQVMQELMMETNTFDDQLQQHSSVDLPNETDVMMINDMNHEEEMDNLMLEEALEACIDDEGDEHEDLDLYEMINRYLK